MDSEAQSAALNIDWMGTPSVAALDAAAPLVECAEKVDVSTPASSSCFLIHLAIVDPLTGL